MTEKSDSLPKKYPIHFGDIVSFALGKLINTDGLQL